MKNPFEGLQPLTVLLLANAGCLMTIGFLTDFRYLALNLICVILSVICALLNQWMHEKDNEE